MLQFALSSARAHYGSWTFCTSVHQGDYFPSKAICLLRACEYAARLVLLRGAEGGYVGAVAALDTSFHNCASHEGVGEARRLFDK